MGDNQERKWLVKSLATLLQPAFEQHGFTSIPLSGEDKRSREIRNAFPFGRLHRSSPKGIELLEIQLDKRGKAAFRLNAGIVPNEGINHALGGHIKPDNIWVGYLEQHYQIVNFPFFHGWPLINDWFHVRQWPWQRVSSTDFDNLVISVVGIIPEIEAALQKGALGKHVRFIGK